MTNIRFTPTDLTKDIDELNKKIHERIDLRVFMFCNYKESIFTPISADGVFQSLVMELYKVFIDVNPVMKRLDVVVFGKKIKYAEWTKRITDNLVGKHTKAERLFYDMKTIENLRSVYGHNNNELNGSYENDNIENTYRWNQKCFQLAAKNGEYTGSIKNTPSSIEDYSVLINHGLLPVWNECKSIINDIIEYISNSNAKNEIISRWIDEICDNYIKNPKYFRGQLASFVKLNAYDSRRYNMYVDDCYRSLTVYNSRCSLNVLYELYRKQKKDEGRAECIRCRDKEIDKCKKRIAIIKRDAPKRNGETDYERYYLDCVLPRFLKNEIAIMSNDLGLFMPVGYGIDEDKGFFKIWRTGAIAEKCPKSLLPHDLLQEIVYQCFEGLIDDVLGIVELETLPQDWTVDY